MTALPRPLFTFGRFRFAQAHSSSSVPKRVCLADVYRSTEESLEAINARWMDDPERMLRWAEGNATRLLGQPYL